MDAPPTSHDPLPANNWYRVHQLVQSSAKSHVTDDVEHLVNILPSYQMYEATLSRSIYRVEDSNSSEPPQYFESPTSMSPITPGTPAATPGSSSPNTEGSEPGYFDTLPNVPPDSNLQALDPSTSYTRYEDTVLANTEKLKYLPKLGVSDAKKVEIRIRFTEKIGKAGEQPVFINPDEIRLQQSDFLYGYVTVKNTTDKKIPFDMFSVSLEGIVTLGSKGLPLKFLNMFDFNASWCDGTLDRFINDNHDPHSPLKHDYDPTDNTYIQLSKDKILYPNITYKKFFAFKLPERLLDYACELHGFIKHLQILPSMGTSQVEIVNRLRRKHELSELEGAVDKPRPVDFLFPDSSISYNVSARIIGRSDFYKELGYKSAKEEYVVVNRMEAFIRVTPKDHPLFVLNRKMIDEEARLMFWNKVNKIEEIINTYKTLRDSPDGIIDDTDSTTKELNKLKQSYYHTFDEPARKSIYEVFVSYSEKKNLLSPKSHGLLSCSTPKTSYYIEPLVHDQVKYLVPSERTKVRIPIKVSCAFKNGNIKLPEFESIAVDLNVLTVKSKGIPIPLVFHPDVCYENNSEPHDDFDHLVIKRFQNYAQELSIILKNNPKRIQIENNLIRDIKALACLKTTTSALKIAHPHIIGTNGTAESVKTLDWSQETSEVQSDLHNQKYFKQFTVEVDVANSVIKHSESAKFRLIPDFQNCYIARMYFVNVKIKCSGAAHMSVKVPLTIQHPYNPTK